jgi:tetratricopeptide (TPR) repeat protein
MSTANTDFHLSISRQQDRYIARVTESPVGQASAPFDLPFSRDEVRQLSWRAGFSPRDIALVKSPERDTPLTLQEFGTRLFDALFAGSIGQLFSRSLDASRRDNVNLRVRLQFDDVPEVAELPWEFLYSRDLDRFLALSTRTPLVRYIALAQPERALATQLPLRILAVVSNPRDVPRLDVEQEWQRLNQGVEALVSRGAVELVRLQPPTLANLRQTLRHSEFHILHFIGHGLLYEPEAAQAGEAGSQSNNESSREEGSLIFEDAEGNEDRVTAVQIATLLHDHESLRLVFLNACHGAAGRPESLFAGVAQKLVQQGVPAVLAMQFAVSDRTAIALAHEFYQSLSEGLPLESAATEARKAIYSEGIDFEWGTPVLFSRSPDGVLVALPKTEGATDAADATAATGAKQFSQLQSIHAGGDVVIANIEDDNAGEQVGENEGENKAGKDASAGRGTSRGPRNIAPRNIIVGKNNVQINLGGQIMTLPFWLLFLALLVVAALLAYPFAEPLLFPSQMSAGMNIAITDFGQMDDQGRIRASMLGTTLSKSVFDKLNQEYQEVYPELLGRDARSVEIWHDSLGSEVKNVRLGLLTGATAEERADQAAVLAQKINAHMVIYGYLVEEDDQNSLNLDFYYAGDTLRGEPDTVVGRHVLSELLTFPTSLTNEPMAAQEYLNEPLGLRARVLFWVTVALIFDVTDQQERALATLLEARRTLEGLEDSEGQALLNYFIGREAFWLRDYDTALDALAEAMRLKGNYANVYIALGAIHYDRAQLFYTPQPIPPELEGCITLDHIEAGAQSAEEAMQEIDRSIAFLEQAVQIAPDSPWPPIEFPARLALGHAYRLKGQAYLLGSRHELGHAWFVKSLAEFDLAQQAFAEGSQQQYLAWTHLGRAATYQLQAYSSLVDVSAEDDAATVAAKQETAATLFQQAADECRHCLEEGKDVGDLVYQRKVLRCGCEYLQELAQRAQAELQTVMTAGNDSR